MSREKSDDKPVIKRRRHNWTNAITKRCKLTEMQALDCLRRYSKGECMAALAREFGVDPTAMREMVYGRTYHHWDSVNLLRLSLSLNRERERKPRCERMREQAKQRRQMLRRLVGG